MIKHRKILEEIVTAGSTVGFLTFILNYILISYWQRDGFDFLEVSLMTIIAGLLLFILIIPINIYILNRGIRNCIKSDLPIIKRIYQVLISLGIAMVTFLLVDAISFLINDSISKDFAEMLKEMATKNGEKLPGMEDFANLPFGLQNGILTFIFGLFGTLISLVFIKKDGNQLKIK